ncbi:cyclin-like protein [Suillus subalutaceus]|uniref:cyclin-like protein n=1 Tax=Suillus subalutaceus TaxID=48586 RepID=UPI001B85C0E3|nr:cyclin-like protein [Suillus subalutaceus]KAG1853696.1 cyclin-like protein [Suillus subalutaceus]
MQSQWVFPISALQLTPSVVTSSYTIAKELYDRSRGVEFLFRLGSSLGLPTSAMFTAATWFHRFFMRYSMEDYHRQDVAASCIFLATKTEECGRKLRDVARVCQAKITGKDVSLIHSESPEVDQLQNVILLTEEVLLEALCFDFVAPSPHAELIDLFDAYQEDSRVYDYAWSIAHDSYRTPLCVLFPSRIIASACYVLAQRAVDGPHSASLDARISASPPSASLPTPPSHKPASPDASRFAVEYYGFTEDDIAKVSDALSILLEYYSAQDMQNAPHVVPLTMISPPTSSLRPTLYEPFSQVPQPLSHSASFPPAGTSNRTPISSYGGNTPAKTPLHVAEQPERAIPEPAKKVIGRLDLS